MNNDKYINPKNSLVLFELSEHLEFLTKLYTSKKFPKVLMLSGKKGIGKFTLINHFLNFVYNNEKYDLKNKTIDNNSSFYKTFDNNSFSNIIYLPGSNYKNIKIEDIRYLKSQLLKTTILNNATLYLYFQEPYCIISYNNKPILYWIKQELDFYQINLKMLDNV